HYVNNSAGTEPRRTKDTRAPPDRSPKRRIEQIPRALQDPVSMCPRMTAEPITPRERVSSGSRNVIVTRGCGVETVVRCRGKAGLLTVSRSVSYHTGFLPATGREEAAP